MPLSTWILVLRMYKWIFLVFTCFHCAPGRIAANRLSHRTRLLDDHTFRSMPSHVNFEPNTVSPIDQSLYNQADNSVNKRYRKHEHSPFSVDLIETNANVGSRLYRSVPDSGAVGDNDNGLSQLNTVCMAPDSRQGVCYEATSCAQRGGIPMGRCGQQDKGHVCCLFEATCGQTLNEKHVYFRNQGFPGTLDGSQICRAKVNKVNPSICQLKLTFDTFDIAKPVEGNCTQDIFSVSGQNENNMIPRICGFNTGQHYYIAVDESGLVNLQMVLRGNYPRKFDIHVEQIECDSKSLAPPHCLQYYKDTQGTIKSFNYDSEDMNRDMSGGISEGYPNNVDYLICIRKETGFCSVSYEFMSDPSGAVLPFSVGMSNTADKRKGELNMMSPEQGRHLNSYSAIQSTDCDDDYLIVGGIRLCTKTVFVTATDNENNHEGENSLTPTPSSGVVDNRSQARNQTENENLANLNLNEPHHETNGELYEHLNNDASEVEELRRTHRRANLAANFYDYHGGGRRMRPSVNRRQVTKRSSSNLMTTDRTPGPFQLRFVSNNAHNARGFYLAYRQNPCRL